MNPTKKCLSVLIVIVSSISLLALYCPAKTEASARTPGGDSTRNWNDSPFVLVAESLPGGHTVDKRGQVHGGSYDFSFLQLLELLGLLAGGLVVWLLIAVICGKIGAENPGAAAVCLIFGIGFFGLAWSTHTAVLMVLGTLSVAGVKLFWE